MNRRIPLLSAALATAAALTGCGLTNPYASAVEYTTTATRTTTALVDHDPTPERGGTVPRSAGEEQGRVAIAQPTPRLALERFARLYVNWTALTVAGKETELASMSTASARAQALQAAASYRHDRTLLDSQVTNTGTVVAIARGHGVASSQWVVVTRETTSGKGDYQGLPAQVHVTYAQLAKTATGWVVSSWSPQT